MILERPANLVETYKTCKNKYLTDLSKDAAKTSQRVSCYCFRETHICSVQPNGVPLLLIAQYQYHHLHPFVLDLRIRSGQLTCHLIKLRCRKGGSRGESNTDTCSPHSPTVAISQYITHTINHLLGMYTLQFISEWPVSTLCQAI